jgi:hypothetical protein
VIIAGQSKRMRANSWVGAPLVVALLPLGGCLGSPTYGTDKTATAQLASDVTGILSLGPKRKQPIDYKPRPDLVRPAPGEKESLPAPQDNVTVASNPDWPESPEQMRARLRAEATANQDNPNYRSPIVSDVALNESKSTLLGTGVANRGEDSGINEGKNVRQNREEFNRRVAMNKQGSDTDRKYLSEPPLSYRQAAPTAPTGDVGEDEWKKERRAKAAAGKSQWSWRNLIPGL